MSVPDAPPPTASMLRPEWASTIPRRFRETVRRRPDMVALRHKDLGLWHDTTWRAYGEAVEAVALALRERGLAAGDRVGIIGDNSPEWVTADLGVQCAGGVTVGIYATNSAEQVAYILDDAGVRFLFVENEEQLDKWLAQRDALPALEQVFVWDLEGLRDFRDPQATPFAELVAEGRGLAVARPDQFDALVDAVLPENTAVLVYTSGTTGPPKGAMLSHRNCTWMARRLATNDPVVAFGPDDEVLSFLPLCHIFERLFSVLLHVDLGYTVNFVESLDTVMPNLREVSPTIGYAVPRLWEKIYAGVTIRMADATWFKRVVFALAYRLAQAATARALDDGSPGVVRRLGYALAQAAVFRKLRERLGMERMRVAYSGAAPISPDVLRFYRTIGLNLVEGYGQTEGTGVTATTRTSRVRPGAVGEPLEGVEVRLADDGEILVRGPNVFQGYWGRPDATARTIVDGWLHSGDIGAFDDDGFLRIVDRKKDLIITAGGKNVAPQYIENLLKFSLYINDAIVVGDRRKYLTALVVLDEDTVVKYAQDHKVPFSTYAELAGQPEINALVQREIDAVNRKLARVETIRKFRILPRRLYEEDGDVTPTMKVKRRTVEETYADLIEAMYAGG